MEIRNLISFLRVAELGNFTKAAKELGYSQAAVTVHINQLEKELNTPLFERIGNKNIVTPVGQHLVQYANQMLRIHEDIINLTKTDLSTCRGTLRLGAIESVASSFLVPVIGEFHKIYPNVNIELTASYNKALYDALAKNEADIIFTISNDDAPQHCQKLLGREESAHFFASSGHPLAQQDLITAEMLFDYPLILTGANSFLEREVYRLADFCKKEIQTFMRCNTTNTILGLVEQDFGISFLGRSNLTNALAARKIAMIPVKGYSFSYKINVYRNRNKWISPQMSGFIPILERKWSEE